MRIVMTPGLCSNEHSNTGGSFCQSCFASFLTHGARPELPCISAAEDDGADRTTLVLRYAGHEQTIELTDERREQLAFGDWKGWVEYAAQLSAENPQE
jgi:hypothetical protein